MMRQILFVFSIFLVVLVSVQGREDTHKEKMISEANELKKLIHDTLAKLHEHKLDDEGENLKRFSRDVAVVERHIEQAGNDPTALRSASIVLSGLSKKIHDEVQRCDKIEHHHEHHHEQDPKDGHYY